MKISCPNQHCKDYGKENTAQIIRHGKDRHGYQRWLCKSCDRTFIQELVEEPMYEPWQRKKPQKGLKSQRGQGEMYGEVKRKQTLSLTPTAVKGLDLLAESLNISRSELVERIGRGLIPLFIERREPN